MPDTGVKPVNDTGDAVVGGVAQGGKKVGEVLGGVGGLLGGGKK